MNSFQSYYKIGSVAPNFPSQVDSLVRLIRTVSKM